MDKRRKKKNSNWKQVELDSNLVLNDPNLQGIVSLEEIDYNDFFNTKKRKKSDIDTKDITKDKNKRKKSDIDTKDITKDKNKGKKSDIDTKDITKDKNKGKKSDIDTKDITKDKNKRKKSDIDTKDITKDKKMEIKLDNIYTDTANKSEWDNIPDSNNIRDIKLHYLLKLALIELHCNRPTPVQQSVLLENIYNKCDNIICAAPTGSGKTLAFVIPILNNFLYNSTKSSALIIAPVRELAIQINNVITELINKMKDIVSNSNDNSINVNINSVCVVGGISIQKQNRIITTIKDSANDLIIVGTPGRIYDLLLLFNKDNNKLFIDETKNPNLKYFILDECDRLLINEKTYPQLYMIFNYIHHLNGINNLDTDNSLDTDNIDSSFYNVSKLLFSATACLPNEIRKGKSTNNKRDFVSYITNKISFSSKPKLINITTDNTDDTPITDSYNNNITGGSIDNNISTVIGHKLIQYKLFCIESDKDSFLYYILFKKESFSNGKSIIFCNSIFSVKKLYSLFRILKCKEKNIFCLYSKMIQKKRLQNIEGFSNSNNSILITTDIAARGIDISNVLLIIHYNIPNNSELYIHRVGRGGRGRTDILNNSNVELSIKCNSIVIISTNREEQQYKKLLDTLNYKVTKANSNTTITNIIDNDLQMSYAELSSCVYKGNISIVDLITLASKLNNLILERNKALSNNSWLIKQSKLCDIDIDSSDIDSDAKDSTPEKEYQLNMEIQTLQKRLNAMLY